MPNVICSSGPTKGTSAFICINYSVIEKFYHKIQFFIMLHTRNDNIAVNLIYHSESTLIKNRTIISISRLAI